MGAVDSFQSRVQKREPVNGQWTTLADTTLNQVTKVDISHPSVMYQTSVRKQRATGQQNVWWHMHAIISSQCLGNWSLKPGLHNEPSWSIL